MANAEQFGRLSPSLPLVEQGASFHPRALPLPVRSLPASNYYYCCHRGSYRRPRPPLPLPPSSSSPAAGIMKVATSPAAPAHTSRSRRPSRPPPHRRCIVRLLSRSCRRRRRDLLLAFEMIMPSRPGDTETDRKEERKKRVTASRAERERIS